MFVTEVNVSKELALAVQDLQRFALDVHADAYLIQNTIDGKAAVTLSNEAAFEYMDITARHGDQSLEKFDETLRNIIAIRLKFGPVTLL